MTVYRLLIVLLLAFLVSCGGGGGGGSTDTDNAENSSSETSSENADLPSNSDLGNGDTTTDGSNMSDEMQSNPGVNDDAGENTNITETMPEDDSSSSSNDAQNAVDESAGNESEGNARGPLMQIAPADSPLDGTQGVSMSIGDNTVLYLLGENQADRRISADENYTDGNMTTAIGGAFFQFTSSDSQENEVVVQSQENIRTLYMCNKREAVCRTVPISMRSPDSFSFTARPDWFYVFAGDES